MNPQTIQTLREWRLDPVKFVRDNFRVEPDLWQIDALRSIGGDTKPRRRLCMKACTGPGKSAVLAWIGWYRLTCFARPGEHPKGAALSGEGAANLKDNLWSELAKWQGRSEFLKAAFTWQAERIYANDHKETWFLSFRSYQKDANTEAIGRALSGLHSPFPFILLDETGDMPMTVGQKAEQIFTGGCVDGLIAQSGNPTSTNGLLYHSAQLDRQNWNVITITADPDDPKRTPRVDVEHAREKIQTYGRDNPWVKATILGEFPPGGFNTLVSLADVEGALKRDYTYEQVLHAQKRLGVDVARFGSDRTVIFPRQGKQAYQPVELRGATTNDIAARIALSKHKWKSEHEYIDGTGGYGAGVVDQLRVAGHQAHEIHFSSKATDPRFFNKRTEMWWRMAEWVKDGGALPDVPGLVKELTAPTYSFQNGKIRLEEKDQIIKRLGFSPDLSDALALTFADVEAPGAAATPFPFQAQRGKMLSEWDTFQDQSN